MPFQYKTTYLKKDELISLIGNAVVSRSQILKGEKNGK